MCYRQKASISQDYWGDIKEDWGSVVPSGVQGRSPGRGSKVKLFCETTQYVRDGEEPDKPRG